MKFGFTMKVKPAPPKCYWCEDPDREVHDSGLPDLFGKLWICEPCEKGKERKRIDAIIDAAWEANR